MEYGQLGQINLNLKHAEVQGGAGLCSVVSVRPN